MGTNDNKRDDYQILLDRVEKRLSNWIGIDKTIASLRGATSSAKHRGAAKRTPLLASDSGATNPVATVPQAVVVPSSHPVHTGPKKEPSFSETLHAKWVLARPVSPGGTADPFGKLIAGFRFQILSPRETHVTRQDTQPMKTAPTETSAEEQREEKQARDLIAEERARKRRYKDEELRLDERLTQQAELPGERDVLLARAADRRRYGPTRERKTREFDVPKELVS